MTDAESRLRAWVRDFGAEKPPGFIADVDALLAEVLRLRADLAAAQRVAESLADRVAAQSELLSRRAEGLPAAAPER